MPGDEAVGKEAARYIRFASAAYGMLMLKVHFCFSRLVVHSLSLCGTKAPKAPPFVLFPQPRRFFICAVGAGGREGWTHDSTSLGSSTQPGSMAAQRYVPSIYLQ